MRNEPQRTRRTRRKKERERQQIFDYTQRAGEAAGVKLDFEKVRLAVNTRLSHQLIALAPANVKNDVVEAIYRAYFEEALNIGDINVIVAIGTAYQMDSTELKLQLNNRDVADVVVTESEFARLNGFNSVPFFIMNNQVKVNGSRSVEVFLEALNSVALLDIPAKI